MIGLPGASQPLDLDICTYWPSGPIQPHKEEIFAQTKEKRNDALPALLLLACGQPPGLQLNIVLNIDLQGSLKLCSDCGPACRNILTKQRSKCVL